MFIAKAFGGEYPVCTEDQKAKMEAAFESAAAYDEENPGNVHKCTCELIIELLNPNPSRSAVIEAAATIAQDVFAKKAIAIMLAKGMENNMLRDLPVPPEGKGN